MLFMRGGSAASFASRVGLESLLPAVAGLAVGLGGALLALQALSPAGTIDGATVATAAARAAAACAAAVACIAAGAAATYPRQARGRVVARRLARVPWSSHRSRQRASCWPSSSRGEDWPGTHPRRASADA